VTAPLAAFLAFAITSVALALAARALPQRRGLLYACAVVALLGTA